MLVVVFRRADRTLCLLHLKVNQVYYKRQRPKQVLKTLLFADTMIDLVSQQHFEYFVSGHCFTLLNIL